MDPEQQQEAVAYIERQVLGSILNCTNGNSPIPIPTQIFSDPKHRIIAEAINQSPRHDPTSIITQLTSEKIIDKAGGAYYVCSLVDDCLSYSPANLTEWLRQLESHYADRKLKQLHTFAGYELNQDQNPVKTLSKLADNIQQTISETTPSALTEAAVSLQKLLETPPQKPDWIIGDIMPVGSLNFLSGIPGSGKSFFCLQLAASLSTGKDFLGFLRTRPATTVYIGLELPDYETHQRYQSILKTLNADPSRIHLLLYPRIPYPLDLPNPKHVADLTQLCKNTHADLLIIDPLVRAHCLDENSNKDMIDVLTCFDSLRTNTGTAVLLSHHESTKGTANKTRADVDAARGASVFSSHPTLIMRLVRKLDFIQLRFGKATFGKEPKPAWLEHNDSGTLIPSKGPSKKTEEAAENISSIKNLALEHPNGFSLDQAMQNLPYPRSVKTIRKLLKDLGFTPPPQGAKQGRWTQENNTTDNLPPLIL